MEVLVEDYVNNFDSLNEETIEKLLESIDYTMNLKDVSVAAYNQENNYLNQSLQANTDFSNRLETNKFKNEEPEIATHPSKHTRRRTSVNCDICHRTFSDSYNLRVHKMQHSDEFRYDCPECGKRFRQRNKMEMHRVTHTKSKPYTCDICGKDYRFRDYLTIHQRLHQSVEMKPYKCKFCEESFRSLHLRRTHTNAEHAESVRYTCPVAMCGKTFIAHCHLLEHIKRHTNRRDFKCKHCQKCFFCQAHLKSHLLTHTDAKPFECDMCQARFQRKSNLNQHLKIHSDIKSYTCSKCEQSFAQKAGLSAHWKKVHG